MKRSSDGRSEAGGFAGYFRPGRLHLALLAILVPWLALEVALLARPYEGASLAVFPESRRIYDAGGVLLREVVNGHGERAMWTPLAEMSPLVADAVIAVEDARFHEHSGVDVLSVFRAFVDSVPRGRIVSGASTLTMQLARLLDGHPRTARGKLTQAFGALRIERAVGKDVILEQYLNRAPFGAGAVGLEAASHRYFGKPSRHLSLAEAALLAGLPQGPSILNPLRDEGAARRRQRRVLDRLLATGKIEPRDYERALREPFRLVREPEPPSALHFTDHILAQGPPPGDVHTTLDSSLQRRIEALVAGHVKALSTGGLTNAAVVVLDNRDCRILAMVGSASYWRDGAVNGATARRQPGSTIKPFTYALGFERLYTPATVVADVETRYPGVGGELYRPRNYSEEFSGPVLMSEALSSSLNVPAVRVANGVGTRTLLERLRMAGFASLDQPAQHYGLGLTLGNGEVTLLELAQAYALFARGGLGCTAYGWAGATASEREALRIFSPQVSYLITDILSDEALRVRAFGAGNPLLVGFPMAIKTGTSNNWRDSWAVGYTERHTVAVWAGDFDGRPMQRLSGAIGAGPLFREVARAVESRARRARAGRPILPAPPDGVERVVVCPLSGEAAGEHCPHRRTVTVLAGGEARGNHRETRETCDWHRAVRVDRRNGLLASERCPSRFVTERVFEVLPARYASWQARHGRRPPVRPSPLCPEVGVTAGALVITHPRPGDVFLIEPGYELTTQSLELEAEVDPPQPEARWLLDGREIATAGWPYQASWRLEKGRHRLELVAGGRRSDPVEFEVR